MARLPVPFDQQNYRLPEQGRIRFGVKDAARKGAPKAIPWFRFTATDRTALDSLAALYGGDVAPWENGYGRPAWQVTTTASEIRVVIPPDALTQWYEKWAGGGCERRCDGQTCTIPRGMGGPDPEPQEVDCICTATQAMACKPKTRLSVVLPDLSPFRGVWRLEAGGEHAKDELPGMCQVVLNEQGRGMAFGLLRLDQRSEWGWNERSGKRELHHYVTPVVGPSVSFDALLAGGARARTLGPADARLALPVARDDPAEAGPSQARDPAPLTDQVVHLTSPDDDDIVDAEIIEDGMTAFDREDQAERLADEEAKTLRSRIAMRIGDDDLRHALARWVSKGRVSSTKELSLDELRRLRDGAEKIARGEVVAYLVDGEARVEKAS